MDKNCTKCKEIKREDEFTKNSLTTDGLSSWCKDCACSHSKQYRLENPEKIKEQNARRDNRKYNLKAKYNMTKAQVDELNRIQDGKCLIHGEQANLHVDHDHDTGIVRGLLCNDCNTGLGKFQENPELLLKAYEYLAKRKEYAKVIPVVLVKNEEYFLPYCLESIAGHFERVVIYDVGSEDATVNIIKWFVDKEKHRTDFRVKYLPDCPPAVQGTFRNSMITESESEVYWIIDGDEIYNKEDIIKGKSCAQFLYLSNLINTKKRFGVFRRIEVSADLKQRYDTERTHHRLYHRSAIWKGTHPGEESVYKQNEKSEVHFTSDVRVLHMHNALRSSFENKTHGRIKRKNQSSYITGSLTGWNLLNEYPILKRQIADFKSNPELEMLRLWV